jgi:hypothetical protein
MILYWMNLHNATWIECNSIDFKKIFIKLKWIEPNTTFFSFGFNMVSVLFEIWIEFGWIELNWIEFKLLSIEFLSQLCLSSWIQTNYKNSIMRRHVDLYFHIQMGWWKEWDN